MQLVKSSDILCFTTDAPQNSNHVAERVSVPLSDTSAHATFFLVALKESTPRVHEIVDCIKDSQ